MRECYWIFCAHCGKKLIQRSIKGLFYFRFGKPVSIDNDGVKKFKDMSTPVEMLVHGSIKMRCWHRDCREWNVLSFFPPMNTISRPAESGYKGINKSKKKGGDIECQEQVQLQKIPQP